VKQPRSKRLSNLGKYLWDQRLTDSEFAEMMRAELQVPKFSASTVENWRYGTRNPTGKNLVAVVKLSGLTADTILGIEAA